MRTLTKNLQPAAPLTPWNELLEWLRMVEVPDQPIRTSSATVLINPRAHVAYLREQMERQPAGQHKVGIWSAAQRLFDAMLLGDG